MELRFRSSTVSITRERVIGLTIVLAGVILLAYGYSVHLDVLEIGETTDPDLQQRLSSLEDKRDASIIASIGFLFLGVFSMAILGERSSPRPVSEDGMISAARMAAQTTAAFSLAGNASYLPAKHGLTRERIFIPSAKSEFVPPAALSDDLILSPGKDGSTPGIALEPLGLPLLARIEKELNTSLEGAGIEAAEGTLQMLKHGFDIIRDFHFKEREGKMILRVEYKDLLDACRTVRKEMPDTCRQMACIGCACILTAAARATGKVAAVESVDNDQDTVVFTLTLKDW